MPNYSEMIRSSLQQFTVGWMVVAFFLVWTSYCIRKRSQGAPGYGSMVTVSLMVTVILTTLGELFGFAFLIAAAIFAPTAAPWMLAALLLTVPLGIWLGHVLAGPGPVLH